MMGCVGCASTAAFVLCPLQTQLVQRIRNARHALHIVSCDSRCYERQRPPGLSQQQWSRRTRCEAGCLRRTKLNEFLLHGADLCRLARPSQAAITCEIQMFTCGHDLPCPGRAGGSCEQEEVYQGLFVTRLTALYQIYLIHRE